MPLTCIFMEHSAAYNLKKKKMVYHRRAMICINQHHRSVTWPWAWCWAIMILYSNHCWYTSPHGGFFVSSTQYSSKNIVKRTQFVFAPICWWAVAHSSCIDQCSGWRGMCLEGPALFCLWNMHFSWVVKMVKTLHPYSSNGGLFREGT